MSTPIVHILVSVTDKTQFENCTLVFPSVRTGFPKAEIHVDINVIPGVVDKELFDSIAEKAFKGGVSTIRAVADIHHAKWIEKTVAEHNDDRPLVILDADTIFWNEVEQWKFPDSTLLAGYYVPKIWNDFAKCISFPRIHTSFMWFPNVAKLREALKAAYPLAHEPRAGAYCPCDPFMPETRFVNGIPWFWDSCANLHSMLKRGQAYYFRDEELKSYDHLNSASFYEVMKSRMDDPRGFEATHKHAIHDKAELKNLWPFVENYYSLKAMEASVVESKMLTSP